MNKRGLSWSIWYDFVCQSWNVFSKSLLPYYTRSSTIFLTTFIFKNRTLCKYCVIKKEQKRDNYYVFLLCRHWLERRLMNISENDQWSLARFCLIDYYSLAQFFHLAGHKLSLLIGIEKKEDKWHEKWGLASLYDNLVPSSSFRRPCYLLLCELETNDTLEKNLLLLLAALWMPGG